MAYIQRLASGQRHPTSKFRPKKGNSSFIVHDMLGIEDYGSDVESGDENTSQSKLAPPTSKSTFALPPPKTLSLPAPSSSTSGSTSQPKPKKRTKKIAINLPSLPPSADDDDDSPPAKKPRVTPNAGAGKSSLLSMLPAPKQSVPVIEKKKEERVLGGGGGPGLVFRTSKSNEAGLPDAAELANTYGPSVDVDNGGDADVKPSSDTSGPSTSFLPLSLKKGRVNISLDNEGGPSRPPQPRKPAAPAVDFFSLGSSTPTARPTPTPSSSSAPAISSVPCASTSAPAPSTFTLSSAPAISTFRPPSPTLDDPYPGYYQLPSGAYAPYDAEYYASHAKKWKADYDKHIRALEKSQYEPTEDGAQDVDMAAEMEKSRREIKEREDRKALTAGKFTENENGEVQMPKMNVQGAKLGSVARSRHQLTTLLTEAYLNREVLEERISQGRRNRKEAGNKYGF